MLNLFFKAIVILFPSFHSAILQHMRILYTLLRKLRCVLSFFSSSILQPLHKLLGMQNYFDVKLQQSGVSPGLIVSLLLTFLNSRTET